MVRIVERRVGYCYGYYKKFTDRLQEGKLHIFFKTYAI